MITYETETRLASPFPSIRIYRVTDGVKDREPIAIFPPCGGAERDYARLFVEALQFEQNNDTGIKAL